MKKPKQVNYQKKYAIPIGPRFQADVAVWDGLPQRKYPHKTLESSKWLGTVIWSHKDTTTQETERGVIGRGRPHHCDCYIPGSILCVKRHIFAKSAHLKKDLGAAFRIWKFDEMGEVVSKLWKLSEQHKFACILKKNPKTEGNSFIKLALESFPSKSVKNIVNYYFNVYLPRQLSVKTRTGCTDISTDDEEDKLTPCCKGPQKRARVDCVGPTSKILNVGYLTGRR